MAFWLVIRCRKTIRQRFNLGQKHWREQPWVTMVHWKPNADDKFDEAQIRLPMFTANAIAIKQKLLPTPTKDGSIPLNAETVQLWVNCLGKLFLAASKLVRKTTFSALADLTTLMIYIDDILERPEIQALFHKTLSFSRVVFTSTYSHCCHPCSLAHYLRGNERASQ